MSIEIRVPQLPESVADATLVAWHKKPGEAVRRDENLADLETDKVVLEVPAPANGVHARDQGASGADGHERASCCAVIEEGAGCSEPRRSASGNAAAAAPSAGRRATRSLASSARRCAA